MKIYFYTNQELDNQAAKEIIFCLKRAGLEVITDGSKNKQTSDGNALPKAEAMIFQGLAMDAKSSYLLAFALARNQKVLCLMPVGAKIDSNWSNLQSSETMSEKISIEFYDDKNLKEKVYDFLKKLDISGYKIFNVMSQDGETNPINWLDAYFLPVPVPDIEAIKFAFEVVDLILLVSFFDHYTVLRDN